MKLLVAAILLLAGTIFHTCRAQGPDLWSRMRQATESQQPRDYLYRHNASLRWSWNPLQLGLRTATFVYQKKITYQYPSRCIYSPSCSQFGRQCFETYGPAKALFLTLDRISRCSPFVVKSLSDLDRSVDGSHVHYMDPVSRYQFKKPK